MKQFKDPATPFEQAGKIPMGNLKYCPGIVIGPNAMQALAIGETQIFIRMLAAHYTGEKADPMKQSADIYREVAAVRQRKIAI